MGTIALATLLREQGLLANPELAGKPQHFDLTPKPSHGFGQAKAMISMFMQGGPSHIDLFEPKPELVKLDGKNFPGEVKYDDAAGVYRKLLGRPDVTGVRRAIVLNNLSFLEALSASAAKGDDPLAMAEEAAQIMGPNSEILDTRAVVLTAQGKYKDAIHDLELAVTDNAGKTATDDFDVMVP